MLTSRSRAEKYAEARQWLREARFAASLVVGARRRRSRIDAKLHFVECLMHAYNWRESARKA